MALDGAYEKLKVKVVSRSRGPRGDMFRTTGPWTPAELALVGQGRLVSLLERRQDWLRALPER